MNEELILSAGTIIAIVSFLVAAFRFSFEYFNIKSKNRLREEYRESFNQVVSNLSSPVHTTQLASAILLRRYLVSSLKKVDEGLSGEAINVISSLAKTLPTGVFQKTLVDGLSYADNLSLVDLQKTNLQDALLGNKNHQIVMNKTDLYLSDLSYANLENISGRGIFFYRAVLFCTRIKNCDFTGGDFRGADLTGIYFNNCILKGANFSGAINVPYEISKNLQDGIYMLDRPFTIDSKISNLKNIFFSMPGLMNKDDEFLTKEYKRILENRGFNVIYYTRDAYPRFGQFNRVRTDILRSVGMVAFGFKQLNIQKASYRPNTVESEEWEGKWLSTPWSEIEVGMGLMKGMPILLVSDPDINDGIFDNNLSECFVANISTSIDCRKLEQNMNFDEWISKIL